MNPTTSSPDSAAAARPAAFSQPVDSVLAQWDVSAEAGLTAAEAAKRLTKHGPNHITAEKPPSMLAIAFAQLRDPMNLMLVGVTVVSIIIGEMSTALVVALLVCLNLVLGTRQELKAQASSTPSPSCRSRRPRSCATAGSRSCRPKTSSRATSSSSRAATSSRPTVG